MSHIDQHQANNCTAMHHSGAPYTRPTRAFSDEGITCLYPSKRCANPRTAKRNGELHKFCEYHRSRANLNQRRLEQKRRMQKAMETENSQHQQESESKKDSRCAQDEEDLWDTELDLDKDDLQILEELARFEATHATQQATTP